MFNEEEFKRRQEEYDELRSKPRLRLKDKKIISIGISKLNYSYKDYPVMTITRRLYGRGLPLKKTCIYRLIGEQFKYVLPEIAGHWVADEGKHQIWTSEYNVCMN